VTPGQIDWRQVRLRYSTPTYLDDNIADGGPAEWLQMSYVRKQAAVEAEGLVAQETPLPSVSSSPQSWISQRYSNQVSYPQLGGEIRPPVVSGMAPLSSALPIGSSNLPDGNKTWNVIVNTVGANASVYNDKYTFAVSALQCAPGGCPVPPPAVLGNATLWSDPTTWGARGVRRAAEAERRHTACQARSMCDSGIETHIARRSSVRETNPPA
jgi:hypothetical protein